MFQDLFLDLLASLHGLAAHGVLFLLVFSAGIGAPWAQDIVLLAAAGLTLRSDGLATVPMAVVAWIAIVAADALSVWFGHRYGARWIRRPWAARFVPPQRLPGLEEAMARHAELFSTVTRFLPGQRGTLFFIAGTLRMPWRPFLVGDAGAAVVQIVLALVGARTFGWTWQAWRAPVEAIDQVLTLALIVVLVAWWLRARRVERA